MTVDQVNQTQALRQMPQGGDSAEGEELNRPGLQCLALLGHRFGYILGLAEVLLEDGPGLPVNPFRNDVVVVPLAAMFLSDDRSHREPLPQGANHGHDVAFYTPCKVPAGTIIHGHFADLKVGKKCG